MAAGGFFMSGIEHRTAANAVEASQALQAAEAGLQSTVGASSGSWNQVTVGDSIVLPVNSLGGSTYQVRIYPLNASLFLVESTGSRRGAFQRLALFVRRDAKTVNLNAALSVNSPVSFSGLAYAVSGVNANPLRLLDCPSVPDPVSVVALRSSSATGMGALDAAHIVGQVGALPTAAGSAQANDTSMTNLTSSVFTSGGVYDQLRASATITLPAGTYPGIQPVVTGGQCDHSNPLNWGEPWLSGMPPCGTYYPTVYGSGSGTFKVSGARPRRPPGGRRPRINRRIRVQRPDPSQKEVQDRRHRNPGAWRCVGTRQRNSEQQPGWQHGRLVLLLLDQQRAQERSVSDAAWRTVMDPALLRRGTPPIGVER